MRPNLLIDINLYVIPKKAGIQEKGLLKGGK